MFYGKNSNESNGDIGIERNRDMATNTQQKDATNYKDTAPEQSHIYYCCSLSRVT